MSFNNNDISGAGAIVTLLAPLQGQPLIKVDMADDADPFSEEREDIAVAGTSLSFQNYSYRQAKPRYIPIVCMPNTISSAQLITAYNLLLNPFLKTPLGGVTITVVYPSLGTFTATSCSWIGGDSLQSIQSSGRIKSLNFKFLIGVSVFKPALF